MKKIVQILGLSLAFLTLSTIEVIAQETCTEKLYRANNLYEKGKINEAIEIAKTCAEGGSTSDKWQAYRLLALSYLVNNQPRDARKAAEKMLEINPTYKPSSLKDPTDLIRLIKSVKIIPKFTMGMAATVGGNITYPDITGTYNGADYIKIYTSERSWQLGVLLGYNMNEIISINSGLMSSSKIYNISYKIADWNIKVKESLTYLGIPLFARFVSKPLYKFRGFVDAGAYTGKLLSATSDFLRSNSVSNESFATNNLNSEQRTNNWEYGLFYGGGVMYNLGQVNIALDVRYYLSYANITNEDNRYENESLFYNYYFIDDNLRLDNLAVSLSLIYNVNYKVIKGK
ncbi:MAG: porin family protein [Bacteroidota bacterium]|nr:porin family protein [Bacteroidota bacterium]